jgi:dolichyl-phosphate-mannose--protein O-mannosyl transferase
MAGAWAINLLPFVGISRVMFLYHYFTALIWAILMLAYLVDQSKHTRTAVMSISVAALALFIFFAPLSYGLPLTDASYSARVWFSSWR